jgi:hypothetical protein
VGELEPSPRQFVAPRGSYSSRDSTLDNEDRPVFGWPELAGLLRRHAVGVACVLLVIAELIIKGLFLSHFFFRQDDYRSFDTALSSSFGWRYLTSVSTGHLSPGAEAAAWVLARIGLYHWLPAAALVFVLGAAAALAAWRLLRTLLGNRPAIVVPLALYLFLPLTFPGDGWWLAAVLTVPVQLATFMAVTAHLHYVHSRRFRHAVAAAAWLAFGLIWSDKALVLVPLLFALTAGFLTRGPLRPAIRQSARELWRAWLLYLAVAAGYVAVLTEALVAAGVQLKPASFHSAAVYVGDVLRLSFLPGMFGGPWRWFPAPDRSYGYAAAPAALAWLSVAIAVLIIVGSVLGRKRAWRAWAILAGWLALADILPVLVGLGSGSAGLFAIDTRYVADATAIAAIAVGLAFWPVSPAIRPVGYGSAGDAPAAADRPDPPAGQWQVFFPRAWRPAAIGLLLAIAAGSVWSVHGYLADTSGGTQRAYIANARTALQQAPDGTRVVNQPVPGTMLSGLFGRAADAEVVLGPLAPGGKKIIWVARPAGTIDKLLIFGADGRLYRTIVAGSQSLPLPAGGNCLRPGTSTLVVSFPAATPDWSAVLRVGYLASPTEAGELVTVTYGSQVMTLPVRAGLHSAYFKIHGSASAMTIQGVSSYGFCIGDAEAGLLTADTARPPGSVYPH